MRYYVHADIDVAIEADSPEDAAQEFARLLGDGLELSVVHDPDEEAAEVRVTEETADGRVITYYIAVDELKALVRRISEDRPFRFSKGESDG
jgi:hypothetical protein